MDSAEKLTALYDRLVNEQKRLVDAAAEQQVVPTESMLRHIGDLESTLTAVSALIEEVQSGEQGS